jgi:hypothetical protein
MELFRPDLPEHTTFLYLDLDVLLVRPLWPLVEFAKSFGRGFTIGHHFNLPPDAKRRAMEKEEGYRHGYNSSVMIFGTGWRQ